MAQIPYRGNLSAKVFPFLSSQFGRSVILNGQDQVNVYQGGIDSTSGDNNIPQLYYCHNVVPTAQGYKSVGYVPLLAGIGANFTRVLPTRDPNMVRGWIGVTSTGGVYMFVAGTSAWGDVTASVAGWPGGDISIAYANGYTYVCFKNFGVYKLDVATNTLAPVDLLGIVESTIVAITASSNYLILTDGVTVYWSSTLTPEDFVPSLVTGAGSQKPTDAEGLIVALVPLGNGFAIYTSVNVVIASYSQNVRFPWIMRGAENSKGISDVQHVTYTSDGGDNYAWTSAGIQKISVTGATTIMPELTDFLAGKEFEDFNTSSNTVISSYVNTPMRVKLAFIGGRYLVASYGLAGFGLINLTHALVWDTALKRWGKLKITHVACFEITLNSDGLTTSSASATPKKTLGFVSSAGAVSVCNFDNGFIDSNAVMLLGKYQVTRSRTCTIQGISVEAVDDRAENFNLTILSSFDGKNPDIQTIPTRTVRESKIRSYVSRVTGANHSLLFKGAFNVNSLLITFTIHGKR